MEKRNKIIVKWAQEDVETSNNLLNNNGSTLAAISLSPSFLLIPSQKLFLTESEL